MIPQHNGNKANIRNAYMDMLLNESSNVHKKNIQKKLTDFIKKNKSNFNDVKGAMKIVDTISKVSEDVDIIGLIADLSNTMKDSQKYQKELDKIIDMV